MVTLTCEGYGTSVKGRKERPVTQVTLGTLLEVEIVLHATPISVPRDTVVAQ